MAKTDLQADNVVTTGSAQGHQKKNKKRKKFWAKEKGATKKTEPILPPGDGAEYSTNWKALQQLLNQKTENETKVPDGKNQTRTKEEKKHCQQVKPEKGAEKKTQPHSSTSTPASENGLKLDKNAQRRENKRVRNGHGLAEEGYGPQQRKRRKVEPEVEKPPAPDIWFDDVDPDDIEAAMGPEAANVARRQEGAASGNPNPTEQGLEKALVKDGAFEGLTKAVAMDCEMVGVGPDKVDSILARVSIVNQFGKCVYDKYVKPTEKVTDYRTWVSGIRPENIKDGEAFKVVQKEVADILKGRTLVGHAIHNDLKILLLDHPKKRIRDTQKYKPFKAVTKCGRPSLKHLCREILKIKVQESEHSSVQDAQATMRLYTLARKEWEAELKAKHKEKKEAIKEKTKAHVKEEGSTRK